MGHKSLFYFRWCDARCSYSSRGIKGFYDYIRPISAIRLMSDYGQSSDPNLLNFSPYGIKLEKGYVELVGENDKLAGESKENIGKIKLYAWKGHDYISNTETDNAGVVDIG